LGSLSKRNNSRDVGVDGWIILKCILENYGLIVRISLVQLSVGSWERDNEHSASMKGEGNSWVAERIIRHCKGTLLGAVRHAFSLLPGFLQLGQTKQQVKSDNMAVARLGSETRESRCAVCEVVHVPATCSSRRQLCWGD
jgi:hypothetical protein